MTADDKFTDEIKIIFGACVGFGDTLIAQHLGMTEEDVLKGLMSIRNKADLSLYRYTEFVSEAVNNELRRRRT